MLIYVSVKSIGKVKRGVKSIPFYLERPPRTLRELVRETVLSCVSSYKKRGEDGGNQFPLTEEEYAAMTETGRFAFGVHYNDAEVDAEKAVMVAVEAVKDGLVRIFNGDLEYTELDGEINLSEGDTLTFVRLVMLSGRMW